MSNLFEISTRLAQNLLKRTVDGFQKYGKTMDRNDLTPVQWAEHAQEEMIDSWQYLERVKDSFKLIEDARTVMQIIIANSIPESTESKLADTWLNDYNKQFGKNA